MTNPTNRRRRRPSTSGDDRLPEEALLSVARRETGLSLRRGPYTLTELANLIRDWKKARQRKTETAQS